MSGLGSTQPAEGRASRSRASSISSVHAGRISVPDAISLNPEQTAAIAFVGGHCLVLAGAGTGKTRTIIGRAAALLGSGVPADRILILAFTRRASREVRSRHAAGSDDSRPLLQLPQVEQDD